MSPRTRQATLSFQIKKNPPYNEIIRSSEDKEVCKKTKKLMVDTNDEALTPRKTRSRSDNINALTPSSAFATLTINSLSSQNVLDISAKDLPCREAELKEIEMFLTRSVFGRSPASMYISGLPGTGKTAALSNVLENKKVSKECHTIFVNCTSVKSSGAIYARIAESLKLKVPNKTEKAAISTIEKFLFKKAAKGTQKMVLLVLDEIDQLESKFQSVLYKIFEWPSINCSRLVLIGIANAVDLTDRMLPRLRSLEHQPQLLHFRPYTKEQIVTILRHRLAQSEVSQLFAPGSLELISAKVAGQSGDLRRALDLGRRVLEVSKSKLSPPSGKKTNMISPKKFSSKESTVLDDSSRHIFTPKKVLETMNNEASPRISPRKRSFACNETNDNDGCAKKTPRKCLDINNSGSVEKENTGFIIRRSPRKTPAKFVDVAAICTSFKEESGIIVRRSPRKQLFISGVDNEDHSKQSIEPPSPLKKSPRKQLFQNCSDKQINKKTSTESATIRACDVMSVVSQVQGSAHHLKSDHSAFPLHQKLLICSLLLILTKGKNKDVTIGKLHEVYSRVCNRRGISAVDQSGFISLCRQVEMTGAVEVGKGHGRLAKITLQWDETEVSHALQDSNLLTAVMSDSTVLAKKP